MKYMKSEKLITTRGLPKTGQSIVYQENDDGTYQAGWWLKQSLVDNKTRFVAKTINGDAVVLDLATGLMWPADKDGGGCNGGEKLRWSTVLTLFEDLTFAGFNDWRLPNIRELLSIADYSLRNPAIDQTFFTAYYSGEFYLSSTTWLSDTNYAWSVRFATGDIVSVSKGAACRVRSVRRV